MVKSTHIRIREATKKRLDSVPMTRRMSIDELINTALDAYVNSVTAKIRGQK